MARQVLTFAEIDSGQAVEQVHSLQLLLKAILEPLVVFEIGVRAKPLHDVAGGHRAAAAPWS
jgi:hypothetical protein